MKSNQLQLENVQVTRFMRQDGCIMFKVICYYSDISKSNLG